MSTRTRRGFTLIELLVVLGVIAVLAAVLIGGLSGSNQGALLHSSQGMLSNGIALARNKAMSSGHRTRLLVNNALTDPQRYRRMIAVLEEIPNSTNWLTLETFYLPEGVYVVPNERRFISGLLKNENEWTEFESTNALDSRALQASVGNDGDTLDLVIDSPVSQNWEYLSFYPAGTTLNEGDIVLASGLRRDPGSIAQGLPPIELYSPQSVRGLFLSKYGLVRFINDRTGIQ